MDLLAFVLGEERFGMPLAHVAGIVRAVAISRLPGSLRIVEGAVNVRGTPVPVFDLRHLFGLAPAPISLSEVLILIDAGSRRAAFRADYADILSIPDSDRLHAADYVRVPPYVSGVARLQSGLLFISDPERFLNDAEQRSLDELLATSADTEST